MKRIPTKIHGILDYASAVALLILPRMIRMNKQVTNLLTGVGIATAAYSMLTDYELGVKRVIPMKVHLALDAAQGLALGAAPFALQGLSSQSTSDYPISNEYQQRKQKQELTGLIALGLLNGLIVLGSRTRPSGRYIFNKILKQVLH